METKQLVILVAFLAVIFLAGAAVGGVAGRMTAPPQTFSESFNGQMLRANFYIRSQKDPAAELLFLGILKTMDDGLVKEPEDEGLYLIQLAETLNDFLFFQKLMEDERSFPKKPPNHPAKRGQLISW
ncbi:MAG TPA: hypothetical protein VE973_03340 [Candidatus Limnocylindria bacterium]|nr:hypothetical protein [Candidatus Limnocylindria bacterium]